jgi:hypothetical protein
MGRVQYLCIIVIACVKCKGQILLKSMKNNSQQVPTITLEIIQTTRKMRSRKQQRLRLVNTSQPQITSKQQVLTTKMNKS